MSLLPPLRQRRLALLLPVVAGALLLLGMVLGQRVPATTPVLSVSAPALMAEPPALSVPVMLAEQAGDDRPISNALDGLPLDMAAGLEGHDNLYDYARRLRPAAAAGNAQAGWTLSRIHDYCAQYALDPRGYALDELVLAGNGPDAGALQGLIRARQQLGQRCLGFSARDPVGHGGLLLQRRQSAAAGNLAAEAALLAMGQPLHDDAQYRRQLVERVIQSQDPEAFLALSPAMGAVAAGDLALVDAVAGTQFTQLAWQVAACRLGMACGPDSVLMNSYCANAGICSRRPDQDFESFVFDAAVPPQGVEKMNELINLLQRPRARRS
jgi:hypothetical protein